MPSANHCIYIAFHLNASFSPSADAARVGVLLGEIMGTDQVESVDLDIQDKEIIYKVNKPLLADENDQQAFFQGLQKVFSETEEYHPHFTQIHG